MPISDGYEACKNILNLYSDNMIFKNKKPMKNENQRSVNESEFIHNQDLRPIMVACSSYVDQQVIQSATKTGFNEVFLAPITPQRIIEDIFPMIEKRELKFNHLQKINLLMSSSVFDISVD